MAVIKANTKTNAQFSAANAILAQGEIVFVTDVGMFKVGDGSTRYTDLAYTAIGPPGPAGADGADGADGATGPTGPTGPAGPNTITVASTGVVSGTVGRVFFEGAGNVVQQSSLFNYDTSGAAMFGGSTIRGTRLTVVNSSDTATVKNIVVRNAADSTDRLIVYGDGTIKSLPSSTDFNSSNELQYHIENTSGTNVGISFKGTNSQGFIYVNQPDTAIKMGQVVSGVVQPVLSFRYNNDFRAATIRGNSGVSLAVGLTLVNVQPNREWGMLIGHTTNTILGSGGFGILDVTSGNYSVTVNGSTLNVGIGSILATARLHIRAGSATANTAPVKLTSGTLTTVAEPGAWEYNNTFHLTNSDATRRHVVTAPNTTKVTAGAPYANDGYIIMNIGGTDFKIMTTA
jgi:hypothetical protein